MPATSLLALSRLPFAAALVLCALAALGTPAALVGALALSVAVWSALRTLAVTHPTGWGAVMLVLPAIALGTGLLGAIDALSAAACLMSLDAAVRRHHATMLLWLGVGFGMGGAAVLLAPFVAAVLLHRRVHPAALLFVPCGYATVALFSPAAPPDVEAARTVSALCGGAPGVGCVVASLLPAEAPRLAGLAIAAALGTAACFIAHFSVRLPATTRLLPVALLATLLTGGLVPQMHASAFLLAAMVAGLSAATGTRRDAQAAALIQTGFGLALVGQPALGFVAVAVATWRVAVPARRGAANDNPIMMPLLRPVRQPL